MRASPSLLILATLVVPAAIHAAPPVEAYGRLPGVELMDLSPSGERIATIAVVGERRLLIVATAAGKSLMTASVGDAKIRGLDWADDDHVLLTTPGKTNAPLILAGNYEIFEVLNIRISDRRVSPIFEKTGNVAKAVFGSLGTARSEGHLYGYFRGLTYETGQMANGYFVGHTYTDLYQIDLDSNKATLVAKGSEKNNRWAIAQDGTVIAHSEYDERSGAWRLYAGAEHEKLLFEKLSPLNELELAGQGRRPGTVIMFDKVDDEQVVAEISATDGVREEPFGDMAVDRLLHNPDTGLLLGALTRAAPYVKFFDDKLQTRFSATRKAFPAYEMIPASFGRNLDRLIVETNGGDDSGTFWLVDIASGKADPVGRAYATIRANDIGPTSWFKYKAADGLELEGVLTLPPGREARNLPVVVLPHGGPIGIRDDIRFDWWAQAYASAGYAVFQPNYRGSSGYGGRFQKSGYGQWGRKMLTDISDGLAALAAQGVADPKRACIVDGSYGGYAALAGVTVQHGLYRCAVAVAGVGDLPLFFSRRARRNSYISDSTR